MPLYEYRCPGHGAFEEIRSFAQASEDAPCPTCAAPSARVLTVPKLRSMADHLIRAHDRNERSRHEPRVHHKQHDCHHEPHHHAPTPKAKRYTGARPWVVEHG